MKLANVYARAYLESLQERGLLSQYWPQLSQEFSEVANAVSQNAGAREVFEAPMFSVSDKLKIIESICKQANVHTATLGFLSLLARKGRLTILKEISEALPVVRLQLEGGVSGEVVSAEPLEAGTLQSLTQIFSQKLGKKVELRARQEQSLIAGFKVELGGVTYDGSLRQQLERLRAKLAFGGQAHGPSGRA